jgi:hypothetical protein
MEALGAMVHEGVSPESIDAMSIGDLVGWYQVMHSYSKAVEKQMNKRRKQ